MNVIKLKYPTLRQTSFARCFLSFLALGIALTPSFVLATGPGFVRVKLENPLAINSLEELLIALLNVAVIIAIPIIVFFIVYAGFLYVTAQGNAEQVQKATRALTYAVIGGVLIIGAQAISYIIRDTACEFADPSNPPTYCP